jgi:hypothetical protein
VSAPSWDITYTMSAQTGLAGKELERAAAAATPAHQYVPWILVDEVPLGEDILQPSPLHDFAIAHWTYILSRLISTSASRMHL